MSLLQVEGLSKSFGGVQAVNHLNFTVESGAVHAIIGPNGAGKTTTFNLITGIYPPSAGRVLFGDVDITARPRHELAALGVSRTFQNLQIFTNMSALENVMVGRHLHTDTGFLKTLFHVPSIVRSNRQCREHALSLMHDVGLGDYVQTHADALPYGALKRLEIARALAVEPRLLLLDEPAAGCNATETAQIDALIRKIAASGITVVLVEHDMKLVMGISDHIVVLDYGSKLAEGSADEVRRNPDVISAYLGAD